MDDVLKASERIYTYASHMQAYRTMIAFNKKGEIITEEGIVERTTRRKRERRG